MPAKKKCRTAPRKSRHHPGRPRSIRHREPTRSTNPSRADTTIHIVHMPAYPATVWFYKDTVFESTYWKTNAAPGACPLVCCHGDVVHVLWPERLAARREEMTDATKAQIIVDETLGPSCVLDVRWGTAGKALYCHQMMGFRGAGPTGDLAHATAMTVYLPAPDGQPMLVGRWPLRVLVRTSEGTLLTATP